jgi:hypothetical protein
MAGDSEAMDLGPAISLEDALTIIIVILVLRVVLFVPLITIDKAKLYHAEKESSWESTYAWIRKHSQASVDQTSPVLNQYQDAFTMGNRSVVISESQQDKSRYIEAADANNNLLVIRHDVANQVYYSMYIQNFSTVPSFQHGKIKWSPQEKKWFTLNNQVEYNQTPESQTVLENYRKWVQSRKRSE